MTRDEIFAQVTRQMAEMFEIDPGTIKADALLRENLDLDSIDAIDLVVKLQELTGKKIKPEQFKTVRTVGDVLDHVQTLLRE